MIDENIIEKVTTEIATHHRKIIDDWCKAYLAQLYQEEGSIKPGDFILYEQVPILLDGGNMLVKKYWFDKKENDKSFEE